MDNPRPRPKFCVGQQALSVDPERPGIVEITSRIWMKKARSSGFKGWAYGIDGSENEPCPYPDDPGIGMFCLEPNLRQLPPDPEVWEKCEFNPIAVPA